MRRILKQTILTLVVTIGLVGALGFVLPAPNAAAIQATCGPNETYLSSNGKVNDNVCCPTGSETDATGCLFAKYINPVIATLSVLAGIAVVIGIIMGGIQYSSSAGDPQKAAKGKSTITKALVGLVSFLFLYSALQFFSPGGISNNPKPDGSGGTIASQCSKEFLGLKPWFAYLPDKDPLGNETFAKNAKGAQTCNIENFSLLGSGSDFGRVMLAIADNLVRIAGLVAVAFVIVGGAQFLTSQGDPERAKKARETILNALVGVAVAIVAVALVSYIGSQLS